MTGLHSNDAAPPRYLLINPRYIDPMALKKPEDVTATRGIYAIAQPHLVQPAHWALRLIDLQQQPHLAAEAQQWRQNTAIPRDVFCGWLTTAVSPDRLKVHLERSMVWHTRTRTRMLLRYFDPRVLDSLIHILDDAQLSALMGPIQQWGILGADQRYQRIQRPVGVRGHADIRAEQWAAIANIEEVDRIRACWLTLRKGSALPDDAHRKIATWIAIADEHALTDDTDRTTLVLMGVDMGWRIDHTPAFRALLEHHRSSALSLTSLIKQMTTEEWSHLKQWPRRESVHYE